MHDAQTGREQLIAVRLADPMSLASAKSFNDDGLDRWRAPA